MELKTEWSEGTLIITPHIDRLDAQAAVEFRKEVLQHVADWKRVVLNMVFVSFVDSSGLASLVSVLKGLPPGATLRLVHVHANVQALLQLTRLVKVFSSYPSLREALEA
ncbi:STAS domain-containing protein [Hyalangium versicolor]|uniref:STAS domain-containing protein n=1 Tax=Hyalangium versicolor TaxID=2861190 RepID=UPI001CCD695E|nr:STAS domain-containing protein [Hyalangium versicolor]